MNISSNLQSRNYYSMQKEVKPNKDGTSESFDLFATTTENEIECPEQGKFSTNENFSTKAGTSDCVIDENTVEQCEQERMTRELMGNMTEESYLEEEISTNTSILTSGMPSSSYTVYNMGEFPNSSFFEDKFEGFDFSITSGDIVETMEMVDGTVIGYASPNGYNVWFEYAEDSTPENPIMNVRLENTETQEAWEGTMNINDIDPANASKIEMIVLSNHLTGSPVSFLLNTMHIDRPYDKKDYLTILQESLSSTNSFSFTKDQIDSLKDTIGALEDFMDKKDEEEEQTLSQRLAEEQYLQEFHLSGAVDSAETVSRSAIMGAMT